MILTRGTLPLGGMNRSRATLPGDPQPQPDEVFNLRPHREGGLIPIGRRSDRLSLFAEVAPVTFVGGDESGAVSIDTDEARDYYQLIAPAMDASSPDVSVRVFHEALPRDWRLHIPGLGIQFTYADYTYLSAVAGATVTNGSGYFDVGGMSINQRSDIGSLDTDYLVLALIFHETRSGMRVLRRAVSRRVIRTGTALDITVLSIRPEDVADIYISYLQTVAGTPQWLQYRYLASVTDGDNTYTFSNENRLQGSVFPTTSGFGFWALTHSVVAEQHNRRVWSVQSRDEDTVAPIGEHTDEFPEPRMPIEPNPTEVGGPLTLHYTETGYVNIADPGSTIVIPAKASERITALVSSPSNEFGIFGGLLVFCNNETFVIVGDPAIPETYSLEPHALPIGCDVGVAPARIGGLTFVVWQGRLYAVEGSQAKELSRPLLKPGEQIDFVVSDMHTQSVVVRMGGDWYRYYYLLDFWAKDPLSDSPLSETYFAWGGGHPDGPFFAEEDNVYNVVRDSVEFDPYVTWLDVDLGDPAMHKKPFQARVFASHYDGPATLAYHLHEGMTEVEFSTATTLTASWDGQDGLFRFPHTVRGKRFDFKLAMPDAEPDSVLEHPVEVTYAPGYRKR